MQLSENPEIIKEQVANSSVLWIGAISFEDRCLGSVQQLVEYGLSITSAILLEYSTAVYPKSVGDDLHDLHLGMLRDIVESAHVVPISSHSFRAMQDLVERVTQDFPTDFVVFDISCMSKVHAMAIAYELSQRRNSNSWAVAYSVPENYGTLAEGVRPKGWKDIIIAPLAESAQLFNETFSRGLILPGHDADRLVVALAELEPSGGQIITVDTPSRPDLRRLSGFKNRHIIRQLTRMRTRVWNQRVISLTDTQTLGGWIREEIVEARQHSAPLILFPFGPKSLIFYGAFILCDEYPQGSWFVYPIPLAYDVNYTEGIERITWFTKRISAIGTKTGLKESKASGFPLFPEN